MISSPNYVTKALHKFQHPTPKRAQYAPHQWTRPNYGATKQLATLLDNSLPTTEEKKRRIQKIIGTFLYYAHAVYCTILLDIKTLEEQQSNPTKNIEAEITQFLEYSATNPSLIIQYKSGYIIFHINSDAAYLSEPHARSCTGGKFYLISLTTDPKNLQTSRHQKMAQSTWNVESSNTWWRLRKNQKLRDCSTMVKYLYPYVSHSMNSIVTNHQPQSKQTTPQQKSLLLLQSAKKDPRKCTCNFIG